MSGSSGFFKKLWLCFLAQQPINIWLVLDENHLVIKPILEFLRYQKNLRAEIEEHRANYVNSSLNKTYLEKRLVKKDLIISKLSQRIYLLEAENKTLKDQLEVLYGKFYLSEGMRNVN